MRDRRQAWIGAALTLGVILGAIRIPVARADDRAEQVPSYRTLPAAATPRRLLKSPPIDLSRNAPRMLALTATSKASPIVAVDEQGSVRRFRFGGTQVKPIPPSVMRLLSCAAIAPDGKTHATADLAGRVRLTDAASRQIQLPSDPPGTRTNALQFSADGKLLAAATTAGQVNIWNVADAKRVATRDGLPGAVQFLVFAPTGDSIACATMASGVRIHSLTDDARVASIKADAAHNTALGFSPDGKRLAIGKANGTIRMIDLATRQETVLGGHTFAVWGLAFDPWHPRLASASWDGTIKIWDAATDRLLASYKGHEESVYQMAFTADGGLVSASLDRSLRYWAPDLPSRQPVAEIVGRSDPIWVTTYSPNGKRLFVGGAGHRFELWDLALGKLIYAKRGHETTRSAAFSPTGHRIATGGSDREVRIWDADSGEQTMTLKGHPGLVSVVCFTPDGKTLISACDGGAVKLWNLAESQETATLLGHERQIYCAAVSPDGQRLVTGGGDWTGDVPGELIVWDLTGGKLIKSVDGHRLAIWTISFSPDGRRIATSSSDGTVQIRDLATLEVQQTLQHTTWVRPMSYSPDGKTLAVGRGDGSIRLWDTRTWRQRASLDGHHGFTFFLQYAPDGRRLATAGQDGTVRLWDVGDDEGR